MVYSSEKRWNLELFMFGTLNNYLSEIDTQTENFFRTLIKIVAQECEKEQNQPKNPLELQVFPDYRKGSLFVKIDPKEILFFYNNT